MDLASLEAIAKALHAARVRYLIAGGMAVGAHGYPRMTMDLDIVIELTADNIHAAFSALATLGYKPSVPVTASGFSDPAQRAEWVRTKGMQVLNFWSDAHQGTSVDIFAAEPFDFDAEYTQALIVELLPGLPVRFVSLPTLIKMKQATGRPRDMDDAEHLRQILLETKTDGS